jgi:hypothetical protein
VPRLLAACVGVVSALSLTPAAPVPKAAERSPVYFPTRVGDRWTFSDGEWVTTEAVVAVTVRDGRKVVSVGVVGGDDLFLSTRQVEVSEQGVYELPDQKAAHPRKRCLLDHPLKPDTTLEWKWDAGTETLKALGPEKVTVPAGTFEAVRVEWWITLPSVRDPVLVKTCWYAQGVGLVKKTDELPGEGVLKSFTPGKD